ncbi:hypothetical protein [Symbioplanes lichenis]|uniref:hypothetical protein n=1 Tax=Symbioplanes lichenis TaxID=1629072 RepID=UPI00273A14E6|nr:hypothetical protein [Actinoplanes lichenis]
MRLRSAVTLTSVVVGVGVLFLPAYARAGLGGAAPIAWLYQLICGGFLVAALALARRADGAGGTMADRAGTVFGPGAGRAVRWWYLVGVSVGQGVVAVMGGWFTAVAIDRLAVWPAAAGLVLVAGAAVAAAGRSVAVPAPLMLALTVLAGLLVAGLLPVPEAAGLASGGLAGIGAATFMLLFAFVGWEATIRLVQPAAASRTGTIAGVVLVAVVYLVAALAARAGDSAATPGWSTRAGAALAAIICTVALNRNLVTVAGLGAALFPRTGTARGRSAVTAGAAGVAGIALALIAQDRVTAVGVLAVPNAMALAVFLVAALSVVRTGPAPARGCAVVAVLGYGALVPFGWPAVLVPLTLLVAVAAAARIRAGRPRASTLDDH